jgi:uncharacterized protein DUF6468
MSEWIQSALDIVVILMMGAGLVQATRLIRHLAGLQQGRVEMERFVHEFNATVIRAEVGIKGLRTAARDSGDDLEKLVAKAVMVRDELQFIVESADGVAERLSVAASSAMRPDTKPPEAKATPEPKPQVKTAAEPQASSTVTPMTGRKIEPAPAAPSSRAEKELLQALQKLS